MSAFVPPTLSAIRTQSSQKLANRTAVVTGATRGIGRGLAIGLGEAGAHVIITGRTKEGQFSLNSTANAVTTAGGTCETYVVDHSDDHSIREFFDALRKKETRLDFFINNAFSAVGFITDSMNVPYWEKSVENPATPDAESDPGRVWDAVNGVGLKNNYVCSVYATRMMLEQGGVIVNISSWGGLSTLFDAVYAVGKSAVDRLGTELAIGAPEGVGSITLCPGYVGTEALLNEIEKEENDEELPDWNCETPFFVGRVLASVLADKALTEAMNGKIVIAAEAAERLGVFDENGFRCLSFRSIRFNLMSAMPFLQKSFVRHIIPRTLYAPWWAVRWVAGAVKYWN